MVNQHLLERIVGIQKILMGVHTAGSTMSASSKGQERQQFVEHFLGNSLPPIYRFGTGDATDANGRRSGQLDVVIEYPFAPNLPVGVNQPMRLYLAEAVAAVVEVKSNVATQWDEAKRTAEAIAPLQRKFGSSMSMGRKPSIAIPTFVVGYEGWKTLETVKEKLDKTPSVAGILVIENGLYYGRHSYATGPEALWAFISDLFSEISSLQSASFNPLEYLTALPIVGTVNAARASETNEYFRSSASSLTGGSLLPPKKPST